MGCWKGLLAVGKDGVCGFGITRGIFEFSLVLSEIRRIISLFFFGPISMQQHTQIIGCNY